MSNLLNGRDDTCMNGTLICFRLPTLWEQSGDGPFPNLSDVPAQCLWPCIIRTKTQTCAKNGQNLPAKPSKASSKAASEELKLIYATKC